MKWLAFSVPEPVRLDWRGDIRRSCLGGRVSPIPPVLSSTRRRLGNAVSPRGPVVTQATSDPQPVLFPSGALGGREGALSNSVVRRYTTDDGAHFAMWYTIHSSQSGHDNGAHGDMVFLATSDDGVRWRRVTGPLSNGAILTANDDQWWAFDTICVSAGSVLFTAPQRVRADTGIYMLYYTGSGNGSLYAQKCHALSTLTRIGVAISKDGEHFTRIEGDCPSGAILDVSTNKFDAFDNATVGSPCVLYDDDTKSYVMYYHGATSSDGIFAIGRAMSKDGFSFDRAFGNASMVTRRLAPKSVNWADRGVCRPSVVRFNGKVWGMFVEVIGMDGKQRIALTTSEDGITWGPLSLVLDVGRQGQWDAGSVSHPCAVLFDDGTIWLYYTGKRSASGDVDRASSIGVARSDGCKWHSLSRF